MLGVSSVILGLLAVGAYAAYNAYGRYVQRVLTVPGCQAGTGANAIGLDFGQTADAAIIAGVAARDRLPARGADRSPTPPRGRNPSWRT